MKRAGGALLPVLSGSDLVEGLGSELPANIQLIVRSIAQLPGATLGMQHMASVCALISEFEAEQLDGVVVLQGTDTIEETSFLLDICRGGNLPIVVTGALRGPDALGSMGRPIFWVQSSLRLIHRRGD